MECSFRGDGVFLRGGRWVRENEKSGGSVRKPCRAVLLGGSPHPPTAGPRSDQAVSDRGLPMTVAAQWTEVANFNAGRPLDFVGDAEQHGLLHGFGNAKDEAVGPFGRSVAAVGTAHRSCSSGKVAARSESACCRLHPPGASEASRRLDKVTKQWQWEKHSKGWCKDCHYVHHHDTSCTRQWCAAPLRLATACMLVLAK